jgi:hypothetical protein
MTRAVRIAVLVALALCGGCSAEQSNCSEVPGTWSMTFRPSDWNAATCPTLSELVLTAPTAQASECHAGCTCSFGQFSMHSAHDADDFCGTRFEEACTADTSSMSCEVNLDTNTQAMSGACRKTFSNRSDWCDYFFDFIKL